jgi:hypothetical protein
MNDDDHRQLPFTKISYEFILIFFFFSSSMSNPFSAHSSKHIFLYPFFLSSIHREREP